MNSWKHGARLNDDLTHTTFRVWAPLASSARVVLPTAKDHTHPMSPVEKGYFEIEVADCPAGTRYLFQIDENTPRPDPASRSQPDGVHKESAVVNHRFAWADTDWAGLPLDEYIIYELHIGTFTDAGTFEAAISELPRLRELGITAIEIMPVAQFPGERNWGYDGVYPYAAQHSYGGLRGLQTLVNAAHLQGIAVVLDVVYNHLGPEGNYISSYGPYFTNNYRTPWGDSLNFDSAHSDGVRDFFIGNAFFWIEECHIDALRLDAVHAIIDTSALPFLHQLTETVHSTARRLHKRIYVMGENDRNDPMFATSAELGGIGGDTQWSDDFHHALHGVLTGEAHGYYKDFGKVSQMAKAFSDGFVYDGCYSPHRLRHHGADSRHLEGVRFVVCSQNHDQIGNRPLGERLSMLLPLPAVKLAATATILSPFIPLLFMGEETASQNPFLYFVSHGDESLVEAVRNGRAEEFREFFCIGQAPDPQAKETFLQSKVHSNTTNAGNAVFELYKDLLTLRKSTPLLNAATKKQTSAQANDHRRTMTVSRRQDGSEILMLFNFALEPQNFVIPTAINLWHVSLDTEDKRYGGAGKQTEDLLTASGELSVTIAGISALILSRSATNAAHQ